jgi:hypothetical protein
VVPADAGGCRHRHARRHGLATGPALLLAPALAALSAAALLAAVLVALLTATPAVAALATPVGGVDVGGLVLILLILHHGDCPAVLMPMHGEQAVLFHRQPPDVLLVIAFQLGATRQGAAVGRKRRRNSWPPRHQGTTPSSLPGAVRGVGCPAG